MPTIVEQYLFLDGTVVRPGVVGVGGSGSVILREGCTFNSSNIENI